MSFFPGGDRQLPGARQAHSLSPRIGKDSDDTFIYRAKIYSVTSGRINWYKMNAT